MIYTIMTKRAMVIAYNAHMNQVDKSGMPYIFHPFHLAEQMDSEDAVIVALLHDVVEDSDWTLEQLSQQGFSEDIIVALTLLTHIDNTDYSEYISRIKKSNNSTAISVKLADLRHNSDLSRLDCVDEKTLKRIDKYKKTIEILSTPEE